MKVLYSAVFGSKEFVNLVEGLLQRFRLKNLLMGMVRTRSSNRTRDIGPRALQKDGYISRYSTEARDEQQCAEESHRELPVSPD